MFHVYYFENPSMKLYWTRNVIDVANTLQEIPRFCGYTFNAFGHVQKDN